MYCQACGTRLSEDATFCVRCGEPQPAAESGRTGLAGAPASAAPPSIRGAVSAAGDGPGTIEDWLALDADGFVAAVARVLDRQGYRDFRRADGAGAPHSDVVCLDPDRRRTIVRWEQRPPERPVHASQMRALLAAMIVEHRADGALFVTTSDFTPEARAVAERHGLGLVRGDDLVRPLDDPLADLAAGFAAQARTAQRRARYLLGLRRATHGSGEGSTVGVVAPVPDRPERVAARQELRLLDAAWTPCGGRDWWQDDPEEIARDRWPPQPPHVPRGEDRVDEVHQAQAAAAACHGLLADRSPTVEEEREWRALDEEWAPYGGVRWFEAATADLARVRAAFADYQRRTGREVADALADVRVWQAERDRPEVAPVVQPEAEPRSESPRRRPRLSATVGRMALGLALVALAIGLVVFLAP